MAGRIDGAAVRRCPVDSGLNIEATTDDQML